MIHMTYAKNAKQLNSAGQNLEDLAFHVPVFELNGLATQMPGLQVQALRLSPFCL